MGINDEIEQQKLPDRMTQRDRPAFCVDNVSIQFQLLNKCQRGDGERLVDFPFGDFLLWNLRGFKQLKFAKLLI